MNERKNRICVGAIALLKDENDKILMMLRNKEPAKDKWAIPGGKVELFETLEQTIEREMLEELGVRVKVTKFLCNIEDIRKEDDAHWIMPVYETKIIEGEVKNMEPEKHRDLKWFAMNEIPENISYMTKMIIEKIQK